MTDNKLVPDSVVIDLIKRAMAQSSSRKFIIDGFPKTVQQAKAWDQIAEPAVFSLFLEASEKTMTDRLLERAKTSGKDETLENVTRQVNSWKAQTFPVVEYYEGLGKVGLHSFWV